MSVEVSDYFRDLDLLVFTDGYESKTVNVNQAVEAIVNGRVNAGKVKFTEKTLFIRDLNGDELRVGYDMSKLNVRTVGLIKKEIIKAKKDKDGISEKERLKLRRQLEKEMHTRDLERMRQKEVREQKRIEMEAKKNKGVTFINNVGNLRYKGEEGTEKDETISTKDKVRKNGKIAGEGSIRYRGVTYSNIDKLAKKYGKTGVQVRKALEKGRSLDDALGILGYGAYVNSEEVDKILKKSSRHLESDVSYTEITSKENRTSIVDKRYIDDKQDDYLTKITKGNK